MAGKVPHNTVMGPALAASAEEIATVRAKIASEIDLPADGSPDKDAIIDRVAAHLVTELNTARKAALDEAKCLSL